MGRYLLVDDRGGSVLAELASADQAGRVLARLALGRHDDPPVSVVCTDHHQGSLTGVVSTVSMRPLPSVRPGSRTRHSRRERRHQ